MIKYIEYPWSMDRERLHEDVKSWCKKHGLSVVEGMELCGLSSSWSYPSKSIGGPTVTNLLTVCSLMDLDPRDYFVLALP